MLHVPLKANLALAQAQLALRYEQERKKGFLHAHVIYLPPLQKPQSACEGKAEGNLCIVPGTNSEVVNGNCTEKQVVSLGVAVDLLYCVRWQGAWCDNSYMQATAQYTRLHRNHGGIPSVHPSVQHALSVHSMKELQSAGCNRKTHYATDYNPVWMVALPSLNLRMANAVQMDCVERCVWNT